jgi:hypothetical protein
VPAFAWVGAAAAALVASVFIMLKGGMVERPAKRMPIADAGGGSPSGAGIPELGTDEDPFRRYPRPRENAGAGPEPTQTETQMLSNGDGWAPEPASEPAWSYASAGDGSTVGPSTGTTYPAGWWNPETTPTAPWSQPGDAPTTDYSPATQQPQRSNIYPTSPVPVATADPAVYRVPGTNIKLT